MQSHYLVEIRVLGGELVGGESTSWLARWFVGGMTVNLLKTCNHIDKPVEGVSVNVYN